MKKKRPQMAFVSAYPPDKGRLSEYSHALLGAISERGVRILVGSDSPAGAEGGIEVEELWKPDDLPSMPKILRFAARSRARVVVFNTSFTVYGRSRLINFLGFVNLFLATQLGKVMGFRTVAIIHNFPEASDTSRFGVTQNFVNRTGFLLAERLALSCHTVAVTLNIYRSSLEKRFRRPVFHLPHGTWTGGQRSEPRSKRIVFFGFLSPAKDMALLRGIYDELREKHGDLQLRLVASPHPNIPGSSDVLQWFQGSPGIEVEGYVPEGRLADVFDDCQAVVLPYKTSMGTSGVLHLANSFGVPAVTTDLPEFRELSSEGAGIVVCKGREEMASAVDRLVSDREYWKTCSQRAMDYASEHRWGAVAEELLERIGTA